MGDVQARNNSTIANSSANISFSITSSISAVVAPSSSEGKIAILGRPMVLKISNL